MTIAFTFLNDATGQPAAYSDRTDLNVFTLTVTTDSVAPVAVASIRLDFPLRIFTLDEIAAFTTPTPGWGAPAVAGPFLTLTPTAALQLSKDAPVTLKITGVSSANGASTTDVVQLFLGAEAPTAKLFLMKYPAAAGDLKAAVRVDFLPATVYRTPAGFDTVENVLTLRLTNLQPDSPLIKKAWASTPTVTLSFVYGDDIGSLAKADPPLTDPHSAYNIQVDASAAYKDGARAYEWRTTPPPASGETLSPIWTLQPVAENLAVLGAGAGATAEFRLSGLSTAAPSGATLAYLQFTDFPGFSDCYFSPTLVKQEPQPGIVFFDGVPNYVEAPGGKVTLAWRTIQMARVALQRNGALLDGPFDVESGEYSTEIERNADFALMAFTSVGDTAPAHTAQWTAHVPDAEIVAFTADRDTVGDGSPVKLTWSVRNALSGEIEDGGGAYALTHAQLDGGSRLYHPRKPTTYTLKILGQGDPPPVSASVLVIPRGWAKRGMGFEVDAGQGPVMFGAAGGLTLVGGGSDNAIFQTADGVNWSQTGVADFPARYDAAGCVFADTLWITGGTSGGLAAHDVWRSADGLTWTQAIAAAPWPRRSAHACVAFGGKLWVMGGLDLNRAPLGDVWSSSDGVTWTEAAASGAHWSPRAGAAVAAHGGKLWLFGGLTADGGVAGDLWSSADGATWTRIIEGPFGTPQARSRATLASPDGSTLYLFGGLDASGQPLDDFNQLDGDSWDLADGPGGWTVSRSGFAVWRGVFWFAGGLAGQTASDQVWSWYAPPES